MDVRELVTTGHPLRNVVLIFKTKLAWMIIKRRLYGFLQEKLHGYSGKQC